jgi:hypothetical protein
MAITGVCFLSFICLFFYFIILLYDYLFFIYKVYIGKGKEPIYNDKAEGSGSSQQPQRGPGGSPTPHTNSTPNKDNDDDSSREKEADLFNPTENKSTAQEQAGFSNFSVPSNTAVPFNGDDEDDSYKAPSPSPSLSDSSTEYFRDDHGDGPADNYVPAVSYLPDRDLSPHISYVPANNNGPAVGEAGPSN